MLGKTTSNSFYNKLGLWCIAIVGSQVLNIRPTLDLELRPRILGGPIMGKFENLGLVFDFLLNNGFLKVKDFKCKVVGQ